MFKSSIIAAALLIAGACGDAHAGVYIGGDIGYAFTNNSATAFAPWPSYRIQSVHVGADTKYLGAEIGWQTDGHESDGFGASMQGPTLDAFVYVPISKSLRLFATGGAGFMVERSRSLLVLPGIPNLGIGESRSLMPLDQHEGITTRLGGGVEWAVLDHFSLRATARYEFDPSHFQQASALRVGLGADYHF